MASTAEHDLAGFRDAVHHLIGHDRSHYTDDDRLAFLTGFELLRNQLTQIDHDNITAIDGSRLIDRWMAKSTAGLLSRTLHLSMAEADRRVDAAHTLTGQTSMTGEPLPPRYPKLASVEASGLISRENRTIALGCLDLLKRKFGAPVEVLDRVDDTLAGYAKDLDPAGLRQVCAKIVDTEYPDGLLPNDEQIDKARELRLTAKKDGSYTLSGTLTGECGAKLAAVLDTYARPVPSTHPDGSPVRDPRSHGQRQHDGLRTACDRLLRSGVLPDNGGIPTSVIVTIALADLVPTGDDCSRPQGAGTTADGQHLSPETVGRLLNEAEIVPTVIDARGNVVWQGRIDRYANAADTKYLIARDGGCSFPGCQQPPSHCERHHIIAWADGGLTTVTNLTLVCGYHHRTFGRAGWTVTLCHGLPTWTPPYWLDPHQKPILHPRIVINARHLKRLRT